MVYYFLSIFIPGFIAYVIALIRLGDPYRKTVGEDSVAGHH